MNPLNPNNQFNYQNNWYNADYFNQQNYAYFQTQMQAYQINQGQQIFNAAKALSDYIDAVSQVDNNHQYELFLVSLSVFGAKMGW